MIIKDARTPSGREANDAPRPFGQQPFEPANGPVQAKVDVENLPWVAKWQGGRTPAVTIANRGEVRISVYFTSQMPNIERTTSQRAALKFALLPTALVLQFYPIGTPGTNSVWIERRNPEGLPAHHFHSTRLMKLLVEAGFKLPLRLEDVTIYPRQLIIYCKLPTPEKGASPSRRL